MARKIGYGESEVEKEYDEYLDECELGLDERYTNSRILKEVDEIAYNVGYSDWYSEHIVQCKECGAYFYQDEYGDEDDDFICEDCQEELDENEEKDE